MNLNPYDYGNSDNWRLFFYDYPSTPSSIYDLSKYLIEDEEDFYFSILSRYGTLVCRRETPETSEPNNTPFIPYGSSKDILLFNIPVTSPHNVQFA